MSPLRSHPSVCPKKSGVGRHAISHDIGSATLNIKQQKIALAIHTALVLGSCGFATITVAQTTTADQQTSPATTSQPSGQPQPATAQTSAQPPSATPQNGTTTPSNKTVTLQGITVTGSLIRSVDVETAQPITEISHEALQQQGFVSVGSILQNEPSVG